jgi:ribosome-binding factor A
VADPARARRLAVRIREIVASTLEMQVKDPRLGMVTITDARLTPDLRDATLFYTVYGDEAARAESAAALESARGVLRTQVGRQTGVKFTPTLTFVPDAVPDTARRLDDLLAEAKHADEAIAEARAGAQYAGDPDPYRTAGADDDEAVAAAPDAGAPGQGPIGVTDTRRPAGPVSAP